MPVIIRDMSDDEANQKLWSIPIFKENPVI